MATDPIGQFRRWFASARRTGARLPEAMALATADARGRASVRFVLLKHVDDRGFVFFTDGRSRKGGELRANPWASFAFHWEQLGRQVRAEGRVRPVSAAEADAYWATRPRSSRLAASASRQSAPLASRRALLARWRAMQRRYAGASVPRPSAWTGFRLAPQVIEFWTHGANRLHTREEFRRSGRGWRRRLLQP